MLDEFRSLEAMSMAEVSRMIEDAVQRAESELSDPVPEPELPLWDEKVHVDAEAGIAWRWLNGHKVIVSLVDADLLTGRLALHIRLRDGVSEVETVTHNSVGLGPRVLKRAAGEPPPGMSCDHIDRNALDNRRSNLRWATMSEQQRNKRPWGSSKFYGVSTHPRKLGHWRADVKLDGRSIYVGTFASEEDAARAADAKARQLFGPSAKTNVTLGLLPPLPEDQLDLPLEAICYATSEETAA